MRKNTSVRRQKIIEQQDSIVEMDDSRVSGSNSLAPEMLEILKNLSMQQQYLANEITKIYAELNSLRESIVSVQKQAKDNEKSLSDQKKSVDLMTELKNMQHTVLQKIDNIVKADKNIFAANQLESQRLERTISYELGKVLIEGKNSIENLLKLPGRLYDLKVENENRKINKQQKLKTVSQQTLTTTVKAENKPVPQLKSIEISIPKVLYGSLNKNFSKGLTLLDPISELCWQDGFPGFAISRQKFEHQIATTTSDFAFFESAWKANKSQWLYAFNSPNLQHANAQDLLKAIGLLRSKKMPVVFWNKEDPMHYEMFKPIAKEADFVFTTDSLKVDQYKKDLGHEQVWALPFAAPIKVTNPVGRFKLKTESVCFAGTYYAKNHPDRKKQMDMLLPSLLQFEGAIYDRASNSSSENYQYPEIYKNVIREGVDFAEMTTLYKKFKVFLNVNTITQSPTMMSRRVYELLASGTPVVSTPSKAITEQFPGIVITVRNEEEAKLAVSQLLKDSYYWNKQSVLGIREVMSKHTYEDRWIDIRAKMRSEEASHLTAVKAVKVVAIYHGYQKIKDFVNSIFEQSVKIDELIVLKSSKINLMSNELDKSIACKVLIQNINDFNVNQYVKSDLSGYTLFTTDSVILFKNALFDMLLAIKYQKGHAITRKVVYEQKNIHSQRDLKLDHPNWFDFVSEASLDCLLLKNSYKDKVVIDLFKQKGKSLQSEATIYLIDPFNVVRIEKEPINEKSATEHLKFKYKFETLVGV